MPTHLQQRGFLGFQASRPVSDSPSSGAPPARVAKVSLEHATVIYGETTILAEVSFAVSPGEVVCIVGPSGCGKTTLLHLIAGLVHSASGRVKVDGHVVTDPGADRVMVFQEDAVFPWMTVRKNVEYGLRIKRLGKEEVQTRTKDVIRLVQLEGREEFFPRQLSGGMRKRVDLARALAVEPDVLLMDEPYAALDMMTKEQLQMEFVGIQARTRATALFVTHDLEEALFLGDRVIVMSANPGRIKTILAVPFERPRRLELKRTHEFQEHRGELIRQIGELG